MALESVANGLAAPPAEHPNVSGVVVDIPAQGGYATLVALTDGTTSLYTSGGGGTIGAGTDDAAAQATRHLLTVVESNLGQFQHADDDALPSPGSVRFHVLTPNGRRREDVPEDSFWGRSLHALTPVIAAAQLLVTAVREASEQR